MKIRRNGVLERPDDASRESTLAARFGVSTGTPPASPIVVDTVVALHTPAAGKRIRLKWFNLGTLKSNASEVVATIRLGATTVFIVPLSKPGAWAHGTVREGAADAALTIQLNVAGSPVYPNFDLEEF